jgi:RNA polymerase sigma factor, sigma-70 family
MMSPEEFSGKIQGLQDGLRRFLLALCCGDSTRADDLAQETLLKAFLAVDSLSRPEALQSWVFSIAYRLFLDNRRTIVFSEPLDAARDAADTRSADSAFEYQQLYAALAELSGKERTAVLLYYIEGYSVAEIAGITDSGEAAVKKLLSRGREHLRTKLSGYYDL